MLALRFLGLSLWLVFTFGLLTSTYDMLDLSSVNVLDELGGLLLLVISAKGLLVLLPLSLRGHCLLGWGNLDTLIHWLEKTCGCFGACWRRYLMLDVL